jgi:hypothetical protein
MGWKKRAGEHVLTGMKALDEADEVASSDVASRNKIDVFIKHVSKGYIESALALAEAYASLDAESKRTTRAWVGPDILDSAIFIAASCEAKKKEVA